MALLDPKEAAKELQQKTEKEIQHETAIKWGNRAAQAFINSKTSDDREERLEWFIAAEEYYHESLEHAALVYDDGKLLSSLQKELDQYKKIAKKEL